MKNNKHVTKRDDDEFETGRERSSRPRVRVDPSERDDYDEWAQEQRRKGRKKKHSGERHPRRRDDDEF